MLAADKRGSLRTPQCDDYRGPGGHRGVLELAERDRLGVLTVDIAEYRPGSPIGTWSRTMARAIFQSPSTSAYQTPRWRYSAPGP